MTTVAILIPVLDRPHRVEPLTASIRASSRYIDCNPVFIVSPGDRDERAALLEAGQDWIGVDWDPGPGDYARKINHGFDVVTTGGACEWVFLGADDLVFHPGWIERALACHLETRACVIGTNDGGNQATVRGDHSTHTLVHADYLECGTIDEPGKILHEGYDHQFVDNEFVDTAKWRETWAHATDSLVEHLHPMWGTAPTDATYEKAQARGRDDRALYTWRRRFWSTPRALV